MLLEECKQLNGCATGEAKITSGYNLPSEYVIHTAGPIWKGGIQNEEKLLAGCYFNSLLIAQEKKLKTIAFPSISTGVYRFPFLEASRIALRTVRYFLDNNDFPEKVIFVLYSDIDYANFQKLFNSNS